MKKMKTKKMTKTRKYIRTFPSFHGIVCLMQGSFVPQLIECKAGDFVGISPGRMECISFEFAKLFGTTSKTDRITRSSCILVEGEGVGVK